MREPGNGSSSPCPTSRTKRKKMGVMTLNKLTQNLTSAFISEIRFILLPLQVREPGWLSRYSYWLQVGRSGIGGSIPGGGWEFFFSPPHPDRLWRPPSLLSNVYRGLFPPGLKRPVCEADHSPPSAEIKNEWRYTSTRQYASMAWCLVKHRDNHRRYPLDRSLGGHQSRSGRSSEEKNSQLPLGLELPSSSP
jgi:hypothetical protein